MLYPPLRKLIQEHFGSMSDVARDIGVSPQAVQQWCNAGAVPRSSLLPMLKLISEKGVRDQVPLAAIATDADMDYLKELSEYL